MGWEAEGLALINATRERISTEAPFDRSRDITDAITSAILDLACRDARRTGAHMDEVRIHPATLSCIAMERSTIHLLLGDAHSIYGPAGTIRIIEDESVKPGEFEPGYRRFK
jgi:hypothetical protein